MQTIFQHILHVFIVAYQVGELHYRRPFRCCWFWSFDDHVSILLKFLSRSNSSTLFRKIRRSFYRFSLTEVSLFFYTSDFISVLPLYSCTQWWLEKFWNDQISTDQWNEKCEFFQGSGKIHVFVTDDCKYQLTPINVEDALSNIISNIQSRFSLHKNKQARCYLMEI